MKTKRRIVLVLMLFALALPLLAAPAKYLNRSLVERFIRDYTQISADLNAIDEAILGDIDPFEDFEPGSMDLDALRATLKQIGSHRSVQAVLTKHQWTNQYWDVMVTVMFGTLYEQLQMMLQFFGSDELLSLVDTIGAQIHPDDRALIAEYSDALAEIMDLDM